MLLTRWPRVSEADRGAQEARTDPRVHADGLDTSEITATVFSPSHVLEIMLHTRWASVAAATSSASTL